MAVKVEIKRPAAVPMQTDRQTNKQASEQHPDAAVSSRLGVWIELGLRLGLGLELELRFGILPLLRGCKTFICEYMRFC